MKVSVEDMLKTDTQSNNSNGDKFFSLLNDGESAIVRFLHTDINDFDVLDVHTIKVGGKIRKINCLKPANGVANDCLLCANNYLDAATRKYTYPVARRFYIHLLKYNSPQEPVEQIWDRNKEFIIKLNQLEQDYGPLYSRLYKIVRHGAAGSMDTSYDILPLDKDKYNPENFKFDISQLNYTPTLGTTVLDKTNEEIQVFLTQGNFPGYSDNNVTARPTPVNQTNSSLSNTTNVTLNYPGAENSAFGVDTSINSPRRRI